MKGNEEVIKYLNKHLKNELTAINQYFLHAKLLTNWGVRKLAEIEKKESLEEMKHADEIIERILFLEGHPNLQDLGRLRIGENVEEILRCDLELEQEAMVLLREAISYCEKEKDFVSRELFAKILTNEEKHVEFIETQLMQIKSMGIANYIQLMSI
ncbi:MAG: bacterioferritin [Leptospiraceae bacterium]|nr:bacterioferritin [Leptospiraceae bacterium]MDW8307358.1 bacterioferritin [Leptospiraceae bacterium]